MNSFKQFLEYLTIGHKDNSDAWVMLKGSRGIETASELGEEPEFFHDKYSDYDKNHGYMGPDENLIDFKGRIDHNRGMISVVDLCGNPMRKRTVIYVLNNRYPGYKLKFF